MSYSPIEQSASQRIGTVEFVSPDEIKVGLDLEAPDGIVANEGVVPRSFPRINGYVLVTTEAGYIVGQIEWIAIERSAFPKRKGYQDFGLIDLPFPLRKMRINPLGMLKGDRNGKYSFKRGVQTFPSIGEAVLIPTDDQLRAIVESGDNRRVKIGTSPLAANAEVKVDPDRLFGRHLAVLGNTGSGKSCTVAGLIQWSMEAATLNGKQPNARFIILDPNGEYSKAFGEKARVFRVNAEEGGKNKPVENAENKANENTEDIADESPNKKADPPIINQLKVPLWFWNSNEWNSFMQATAKTQGPLLKRALREIRNGKIDLSQSTKEEKLLSLRRYLSSIYISIQKDISSGAIRNDESKFGFRLIAIQRDLKIRSSENPELGINSITDCLDIVIKSTLKKYTDQVSGNLIEYFRAFSEKQISPIIINISKILEKLGGIVYYEGPDEDMPIYFKGGDFADHLQMLAVQENVSQYLDFLVMRIRSMLSNTRMKTIIGDQADITLTNWLNEYIGKDQAEGGCVSIIDLSLVPAEIIHIVTAVIARITFEALQRYRKLVGKPLPTVLVMEEAHTFIKKYKEEGENQSAAEVCCQVFERIAREGRKYGLGLVLSSQRPSELSQTVLSQCNTFILHRISNDRDQDMVARWVPDNMRGLLRELPSLPSQQAILLGWASELPIIVKMNDLLEHQRPQSDDPDFWDVWSGKNKAGDEVERKIDWKNIVEDWTK